MSFTGIESSLREKWRLLKSRLEEANKGPSNGKKRHLWTPKNKVKNFVLVYFKSALCTRTLFP